MIFKVFVTFSILFSFHLQSQRRNFFPDSDKTLMNKSEREEYDTEFPQHPLSIARASIDTAIREIDFKPEVMELAGFNK